MNNKYETENYYIKKYYSIKDSIDDLSYELEEIAINYDSFVLNETICRIRCELDDLYNLIEEVL